MNRKDKSGGGLWIGALKDLHPVWVAQGDDEVEVLAIEIWVDDFPVRVVTAYGPQLSDKHEKKLKFCGNARISGCFEVTNKRGGFHPP